MAWLRQPHHRAFGFSRMKSLALAAIRFYQRHLSPHKGFCCAYRQHTGAGSCSELGHRAIRRHGVFQGLGVLNRRLTLCGVAHRRFDPRVRPLAAQRGDCDVGAVTRAAVTCRATSTVATSRKAFPGSAMGRVAAMAAIGPAGSKASRKAVSTSRPSADAVEPER